jgi:HemY protein
VRILFWLLLLAAAAVGVALLARITDGYVLFVAPPYRVELSLNLLLLLLVAAFTAGYAIVRAVRRALALPAEVRLARRRQQQERARAKQDAATVALLEGRYGKARQFAGEALAIPQSGGLAALIGARAAMETRDFDGASALLARPDAQVPSLTVPRLMLEAEMKLDQGLAAEALTDIAALRKEAGAHTAALRLELRALRAAGRHAEVPALVDQLVKRKVYGAEEGNLIRAAAHADALKALASDPQGLRAYWSRLSDAERTLPRVAGAAATSFLRLGGDREAAEIVAHALSRRWDPSLVAIYADCRVPEPTRQLEQAERWLAEHSQDAALLHALGVLCQRQQLWGKAQTYLEAALSLDADARTHVALGELLARLGRDGEANAHFSAALKLALASL